MSLWQIIELVAVEEEAEIVFRFWSDDEVNIFINSDCTAPVRADYLHEESPPFSISCPEQHPGDRFRIVTVRKAQVTDEELDQLGVVRAVGENGRDGRSGTPPHGTPREPVKPAALAPRRLGSERETPPIPGATPWRRHNDPRRPNFGPADGASLRYVRVTVV